MKMIKAIIRPEKVMDVLAALSEAGFSAATRMSILGRGKQQGIKIGEVYYNEIPKEMIVIVVKDEEEDTVIKIIVAHSKTGKKGSFGDGKIFVHEVEKVITVSSGNEEL